MVVVGGEGDTPNATLQSPPDRLFIKLGSGVSHFNVLLIVRAQSRQVSINHIF